MKRTRTREKVDLFTLLPLEVIAQIFDYGDFFSTVSLLRTNRYLWETLPSAITKLYVPRHQRLQRGLTPFVSRFTSLHSLEIDTVTQNINRLPHAWNLKKLCIENQFFLDGDEFPRMTQLTSLNMHGCGRITNTNLASLTNLTELQLGTDSVKDRDESLKSLTNLTKLSLFMSPVTGVGILSLPKLHTLEIRSTYDVSLPALQKMTNLTNLSIYNVDGIDCLDIFRWVGEIHENMKHLYFRKDRYNSAPLEYTYTR